MKGSSHLSWYHLITERWSPLLWFNSNLLVIIISVQTPDGDLWNHWWETDRSLFSVHSDCTPGLVSSKEPVDTHLMGRHHCGCLAMPNCPSKNCPPFTSHAACLKSYNYIQEFISFCWYNYGRGWCIKTSQNPGVAKIVLTLDLTTKESKFDVWHKTTKVCI